MPSGEDIQAALRKFVSRWREYTGSERSEAQTFLNELFACYGTDRKNAGAEFEDAHSSTGIMDLHWPGTCIIEMKAPSRALKLADHRPQALDYWRASADVTTGVEAPSYVVLCAFSRFEVWLPGRYPNEPVAQFSLDELPDKYESLLFLSGVGARAAFLDHHRQLTTGATQVVSDLYHSLADRAAAPVDELQRFILQTVWCLFAEDLSMLDGYPVQTTVEGLRRDPTRSAYAELGALYEVLNQKGNHNRIGALKGTRYVNGDLFAQPAKVHLNPAELDLLADACEFDWRKVNPTIFGSLLEGVLGERRRERCTRLRAVRAPLEVVMTATFDARSAYVSPTGGRPATAAVPNPDLVAAAKLVDAARDVTLVAHVNPDADALGSALALGLVLQRRGATVRVTFAEPAETPESLRALDVAGLLVAPDEVPAAPELLIALDTAGPGRLGSLAARMETAGAVLVIDHHATNRHFGTHNLVDERAEATVVLVLRLLDELGVELDEPVARCLYAGLVTDTSCFRRADEGTHALAARLLAAGVDPDATTRALLDTHPYRWLGMLGSVLSRAVLEPAVARDLGLVHVPIRLADAAGLGADELESVIDIVRTTAEAEVAAVLKEVAPLEWSVSLRAKQHLDVSVAAAELGGGGHRLAAGFSASGAPEDVLATLRAALDTAPRMG